MEVFWFLLIILLVLFAFAAWPEWPYQRTRRERLRDQGRVTYGYAPSIAAGGVAVFLIVLFWFGIIAIWWPWAAY